MEEKKKLSYEKLEAVAVQFQNKSANLEMQLKSINMTTLRLNYLFKVVENKDAFNTEFVINCVTEIEDLLTIEEDNSKEDASNEQA